MATISAFNGLSWIESEDTNGNLSCDELIWQVCSTHAHQKRPFADAQGVYKPIRKAFASLCGERKLMIELTLHVHVHLQRVVKAYWIEAHH